MDKNNIEECIQKASEVVFDFLAIQGGYSNGYYTLVEGVVDRKSIKPKPLIWCTPKSREQLTEKGHEVLGLELYDSILGLLNKYDVDSLTIKSKDEGYGAMKVEVVYVLETTKEVPLWKITS